MRWERGERSENLEDRRSSRGRRRINFPGLGRGRGRGVPVQLPGGRRGGGIGIGGIVLMLAIAWMLGINPLSLLGGLAGGGGGGLGGQIGLDPSSVGLPGGGGAGGPGVGANAPVRASAEEEKMVDFVSFVLDDLQEKTWPKLLPGYRDAKLVLFREMTPSACGMGQAAMGPFYCPGDQKVYIDLAFFDELKRRFGAPGDFAQAYVLAHEVGHHIQKITGIEEKVRAQQQRDPRNKNELSVRMELQADCLAGVWGASTSRRGLLEPGDIEEGLRAASAIGDDRMQQMSGRAVSPESWTHGSSEQRVSWLRRGLETGDPNACDTFGAAMP